MKYRKVGEEQETDISPLVDEIFVRLDLIDHNLKVNNRKIQSIYNNLRNDDPLVD